MVLPMDLSKGRRLGNDRGRPFGVLSTSLPRGDIY